MAQASLVHLDLTRPSDADPGTTLPVADRALTAAEQAQVAQAVATTNGILLRKNLETAVEIHRYVLTEFFGGSYRTWADNRAGATPAYDAFLTSPQLRIGREMLRQLIRVGDQVLRMPGQLAAGLSVAQHRALLVVADDQERAQLAERALQEGLDAQDLAELVRTLHPPKPRRRGRPAQLRGFKRLGAAWQAGKALDPNQLAAEVGWYTAHQREQVVARARALRDLAAAVLAAVGEGG